MYIDTENYSERVIATMAVDLAMKDKSAKADVIDNLTDYFMKNQDIYVAWYRDINPKGE